MDVLPPSEQPPPVFTIGHSNRTTAEFVDLLNESRVQLVVDVRVMPRSRANPQFNQEVLPVDLELRQIGYEHLVELGGLRSRAGVRSPSPNALWSNRSFRNYADYALTEPFREGLMRLRSLALERRCALMCAEAVWWRCHRRIIADYLLVEGREVWHIMGRGSVVPARLTPGAEKTGADTLLYPQRPDA